MFKKSLLIIMSGLFFIGCAPKKTEEPNSEETISLMASHLKSVEEEYLPESISDNGSSGSVTSKVSFKTGDDDICKDLDFMECQPRLIRAYLFYGRSAVALTHLIVIGVARDLRQAADNSSGTIYLKDQDLTVEYNKRTLLDFDFLVSQSGNPVGRVSANPEKYTIQFDVGILEKDKADSRGGKIDIQVKYTEHSQWESQITVANLLCNVDKPDDPQTARIAVTRKGELWTGQSMFYNGIAGEFNAPKTCATPSSDDTGLVFYTDFVADRRAAKAAIYVLKRNETSTAMIENFGFNQFCGNYPDLCQALATAIGTNAAAVEAHLSTLKNPFCVRRGSPDVTWNSSCENLSSAVANEAFLPNSGWLSPSDFYQLQIQIPHHL